MPVDGLDHAYQQAHPHAHAPESLANIRLVIVPRINRAEDFRVRTCSASNLLSCCNPISLKTTPLLAAFTNQQALVQFTTWNLGHQTKYVEPLEIEEEWYESSTPRLLPIPASRYTLIVLQVATNHTRATGKLAKSPPLNVSITQSGMSVCGSGLWVLTVQHASNTREKGSRASLRSLNSWKIFWI